MISADAPALANAWAAGFSLPDGMSGRLLQDQIALLDVRLDVLISEQLARFPAACGTDADGTTCPSAGTGPDEPVLSAAVLLDEIPGITAGLAARASAVAWPRGYRR